jgi:hypothetical protein
LNDENFTTVNIAPPKLQLTPEQATCLMCVTGVTMIHPQLFLQEVAKKLGRMVHPSEFNNPGFIVELKNVYYDDFISMCVDLPEQEEKRIITL